MYGLNGASSKHFCIWCYFCKHRINDLDIDEWPIERDLLECTRLLPAAFSYSAFQQSARLTSAATRIALMTRAVDLPQAFVGVLFVHPVIASLPITAPANKKLDAAMGIRTLVQDFRDFVKLSHIC